MKCKDNVVACVCTPLKGYFYGSEPRSRGHLDLPAFAKNVGGRPLLAALSRSSPLICSSIQVWPPAGLFQNLSLLLLLIPTYALGHCAEHKSSCFSPAFERKPGGFCANIDLYLERFVTSLHPDCGSSSLQRKTAPELDAASTTLHCGDSLADAQCCTNLRELILHTAIRTVIRGRAHLCNHFIYWRFLF